MQFTYHYLAAIATLFVNLVFPNLSLGQRLFSEWNQYEYFVIEYRSNDWTTTAASASSKMLFDSWGHVGQTEEFLASKVGWDKILAPHTSSAQWPAEVKSHKHRILTIQIWCDGDYEQHGWGVDGNSSVTWRYLDISQYNHTLTHPNQPDYLTAETFTNSNGLSIDKDHVNIQKQWSRAHRSHQFAYNIASEPFVLDAIERRKNDTRAKRNEQTNILNKDSIKALVDQSAKSCLYGLFRTAPGAQKRCDNYRFGVVQLGDEIVALISQSQGSLDANTLWEVGDTKATFTPTASSSIYITDWFGSKKSRSYEGYAECDGGVLTITIPKTDQFKEIECNYIKTYPVGDTPSETRPPDVTASIPDALGSGSAVVIDALNQYVITNYHVIEPGSTYGVEQGGKLFDAVVLKSDPKNDLALLRITDGGINLSAIPISMDDQLGERVYSAGYPKVSQMGDDIKITEGVISSMSFLSDPSKYQTSVPITNGNSGGALLDEQGNLVGITQGGWRPDENTENVNAAVKSLYVFSLAQTEATCSPSLNQNSSPIDFTQIEQSVLPIFVFQ